VVPLLYGQAMGGQTFSMEGNIEHLHWQRFATGDRII